MDSKTYTVNGGILHCKTNHIFMNILILILSDDRKKSKLSFYLFILFQKLLILDKKRFNKKI